MDDARITPDLVVPNTCAWDRWTEVVSPPVRIDPGKRRLRFVANGDLFNIDRVDVVPRVSRR